MPCLRPDGATLRQTGGPRQGKIRAFFTGSRFGLAPQARPGQEGAIPPDPIVRALSRFTERLAASPLPVTLTPCWGLRVGIGMGIVGAMGLGLLMGGGGAALLHGVRDLTADDMGMLALGCFLVSFPIYWIWTVLSGWPCLRIETGQLTYTNARGQRETLVLAEHARVAIVKTAGRGYQPRLEAVPMAPGRRLRMISLRPFLRNPQETAALLEVIHRAAGDRPEPDIAQRNVIQMQHLKEQLAGFGAILVVVSLAGLLKALGLF